MPEDIIYGLHCKYIPIMQGDNIQWSKNHFTHSSLTITIMLQLTALNDNNSDDGMKTNQLLVY